MLDNIMLWKTQGLNSCVLCKIVTTILNSIFSFSILLQAKEPWQSTSEEKLTIARHHKTKGTDCYKVKPLKFVLFLVYLLSFSLDHDVDAN